MHKAKLPSGLNFEQGRKKREFISAWDGHIVASTGRKLLHGLQAVNTGCLPFGQKSGNFG